MDIDSSLKRIFLTNPTLVSLKSQLYKKQFQCRVTECSDLQKYRGKVQDVLLPEDNTNSHQLWLRCAKECSANISMAQKFQTLLYYDVKKEINLFLEQCKGEECTQKAQTKLQSEIKPKIESELKEYFESKLKD